MAQEGMRISSMTGAFLITFAGICDTLQMGLKLLWFIPGFALLDIVFSKAITVFGYMTVGFVLMLHGVYPLSTKRSGQDMLWLFGSATIEALPGADIVPMLTLWTVYKVRTSEREDRDRLKEKREAEAREVKKRARAQQEWRSRNDSAPVQNHAV